MYTVHIIYATQTGTTEKIVLVVKQFFSVHTILTISTKALFVTQEFINDCDVLIFASPSYKINNIEGQPHNDFFTFFEKFDSIDLMNKPCAVIGTGNRAFTYFCGAVDILEKFVTDHRGRLIVPSFRIDRYQVPITKPEEIITWCHSLMQNLNITQN